MLKIFKKQAFKVFGFFILFLISKFIKISSLFGLINSNLLASQIILPISGMFMGGFGIISLFILSSFKSLFSSFTLYSLSSVYHIPSFFASLSLFGSFNNKNNSKNLKNLFVNFLNYFIPVICALLFIVHPVGFQIPAYTLYWVIPIALSLLNTQNLYLKAIRATFIAHALGTILFIYSFPSDVNLWANLAKIVWIERLIIALDMILIYKSIKSIKAINSIKFRNFLYLSKKITN